MKVFCLSGEDESRAAQPLRASGQVLWCREDRTAHTRIFAVRRKASAAKERRAGIHDLLSIHSQCFRGVSWRELSDGLTSLRSRRISFAEDVLLANRDEAAALIGAGPFIFQTVTIPFMGGRMLDAGPEAVADSQERLNRTIDLAAAMGALSVYLVTGGRGALSWEAAAEVFCAAIAPCVAHAEAAGVRLAIENIPTLYAHVGISLSLRDTVQLAEMAGTGICMDMFACWTEAGLRETIERAAGRLHLVQIADYVYGDLSLPARAVPGDGVVPIRRLMEWTLAAGYDGPFELELIGPRLKAEGYLLATRRAAEVVSAMLDDVGA